MKLKSLFLTGFLLILLSCGKVPGKYILKSPDGHIKVSLVVSPNHEAFYTILRNDSLVFRKSRLGLVRNDGDFSTGLKLLSASEGKIIHETYTLKTGKEAVRKYTANEQIYHLQNESGQKLNINFRVSNDGVAFRYEFPSSSKKIKKIEKEVTTFHFPDSARAWLQPMDVAKTGYKHTDPSYEEDYLQNIKVGTPSPTKAGWVFPALFKSGSNWVLITEANLDSSYCASRLQQDSPDGNYKLGFPGPKEVYTGRGYKPKSKLPWKSPWRIVAVGNLKTLFTSTLGTDLAAPAVQMDSTFIKPGRSSWSWALLKDNSIKYNIQKQFIDYAGNMLWKYCLVDVNWDTTIGYTGIAKLADYAAKRNVGLFLWYNSSGNWNTTTYHPKSKLLTHQDRVKEFRRLEKMGIKGIKVDFFGADGQSMIAYYLDILKDAAKYHLLVDFHGATLPRGWERTYPNLLTMEAVRGFEYITFFQKDADKEANHCAMLPFTRNIFDPMDFTPVCFSKIPGIKRKTTNGFELALSVVMTSGLQNFAETPKSMSGVPVYVRNFMQGVPATWKNTRFIKGYPGKLVILARQSKNGWWYVAGINGEDIQKKVTINLSFLRSDNKGTIIKSGTGQFSFDKEDVSIPENGKYTVNLNGNDGFVMIFK
ncbi:MAG TPA: glycoside hydrolase family 97 catalytic domain-containing protein [Balneolales bacterium]|nr:glycoside hydrolase family 97 catalytic domain-containing protein [Balneolales bacterium]